MVCGQRPAISVYKLCSICMDLDWSLFGKLWVTAAALKWTTKPLTYPREHREEKAAEPSVRMLDFEKLQNSLRQNSSVRPLLRDCPPLSNCRASAVTLEWLPVCFCFVLFFFWSTLLFNTPCASNPRGFYLVFPPPSPQLHWQIRGLSCFAKGRKAALQNVRFIENLSWETAWTEAVQI